LRTSLVVRSCSLLVYCSLGWFPQPLRLLQLLSSHREQQSEVRSVDHCEFCFLCCITFSCPCFLTNDSCQYHPLQSHKSFICLMFCIWSIQDDFAYVRL
jgi:hypothetical protein